MKDRSRTARTSTTSSSEYLLDTNVVAGLLGGHASIVSRVRRLPQQEIALSANETLRNYQQLRFTVLPFGVDDAQVAAEIRAVLHRAGTPIGPLDTLIAGQALARDLILVSRNTREFLRVPLLRVENWEA